uniref:Neugrin-like n=1 Tax=Phallusia mammillata TaxID=59560 RepID=A0A6F9DMQ8_9ASCI|nr:neugrin-like [Phallusia mammillata]
MAARGVWAAIIVASKEACLMQKQLCVAVKVLPVVTQVRGGKHFNRRRVFNRFIKEKYPKIDVSFVGETIEKQDQKLLDNLIDEVPDYQQIVIKESRKRRNIYENKKSMKLLKLDKPHTSVKLTDDQITHIKLLHEENPQEWNKSMLANALNVPIQVVNSALKRQVSNSRKDSTENLQQNREVSQLQPYTAPQPETQTQENAENISKTKPSINPWFKKFKTGAAPSPDKYFEEFNDDELEVGDDDWMDLDEHAGELYADFEEECGEEEEDVMYEDNHEEVMTSEDLNESKSSHEEAEDFEENNDDFEPETSDYDFEIETKDGINYFDKSGRFVYRVP